MVESVQLEPYGFSESIQLIILFDILSFCHEQCLGQALLSLVFAVDFPPDARLNRVILVPWDAETIAKRGHKEMITR